MRSASSLVIDALSAAVANGSPTASTLDVACSLPADCKMSLHAVGQVLAGLASKSPAVYPGFGVREISAHMWRVMTSEEVEAVRKDYYCGRSAVRTDVGWKR